MLTVRGLRRIPKRVLFVANCLTINKELWKSHCTILIQGQLTFLAVTAVTQQKAAIWWVWLASDGGEINSGAVRWMPSWPPCDVQFVAQAPRVSKALKILLAVTQREMCCRSKNPSQTTFCFYVCYLFKAPTMLHTELESEIKMRYILLFGMIIKWMTLYHS